MKNLCLILVFLRSIVVCGQSLNIDSLQATLVATDNIPQKLKLLNEYSKKLSFEDNNNALKYAREALSIAHEQNNLKEMYIALLNIAEIYKIYAEHDGALNFLLQALSVAEKMDNRKLIIPVLKPSCQSTTGNEPS